jgi:GTPase SAR1 family protein
MSKVTIDKFDWSICQPIGFICQKTSKMSDVIEIKVIVVGNGGVGKTSMIKRFSTGEYEDKYKKTIGAAFKEKEMFIESAKKTVKFMLWDTVSNEIIFISLGWSGRIRFCHKEIL